MRLSQACLYILFKNIAFCLIFVMYAFESGFSGQNLYDEWVMALYNVMFSALPVLVYGLFEQDVNSDISMAYPIVYLPGQRNSGLNFKLFLRWVGEAAYSAFFVYFFAFKVVGATETPNGHDFSIWEGGSTAFTANLIVVTLRIVMETQHFTLPHHVAYWGSIIVYLIFMMIYCSLPPGAAGSFDTKDNMYMSYNLLLTSPLFYLSVIVAVVTCLLPSLIMHAWQVVMTPSISATDSTKAEQRSCLMPHRAGSISTLYHLRHYQRDIATHAEDAPEDAPVAAKTHPGNWQLTSVAGSTYDGSGLEVGGLAMDAHLGNRRVTQAPPDTRNVANV
jgi:magnesium-transporting ATPase (P-type)